MKNYKLTIPKPCNENWNEMTSVEKGKFCNSCSKTVVDFTKKSSKEIKDYLTQNKGKRVCGHFYRKQLDSIIIQFPEEIFYGSLSFQKLFILSLIFVMGTTLFSCKTEAGKIQKIDKVEITNTIVKKDSIEEVILDGFVESVFKKDSTKKKCKTLPPPPSIQGITIIETTGELQLVEPIEVDDIIEIEEEEIIEDDKHLIINSKDTIGKKNIV